VTRKAAREVAMHLVFASAFSGAAADEAVDTFFDSRYFSAMADEDELAALYSTIPDAAQREYIATLVAGVVEHMAELDAYIEKYSQGWRVGRISQIANAALRVAMYESLYVPEVPIAAAIDAAIVILKKYEDARTVKFVNGVLGAFARAEIEKQTQQ